MRRAKISGREQMLRGFRDGFAEMKHDRLAHRAGIVVGFIVGVAVVGWLMWG